MAKRKAAGTTRRKSARKSAGAGRKRAAARKAGARRVAAKKTARKKKTPIKKTGAAARKSSASAKAAHRRRDKRAVKRARTHVAKKAVAARKPVARKAVPRQAVAPKPVARKSVGPKGPSRARSARSVVTRKAPALDRARRTVQDDDIVPTPPSSLDLDRTASAARSGRRELSRRLDEHTETGPALTAGDVDADWESAYSVGDEAPGGDNPTPDQDVVDDIGKAVGVQYEDNEELKGEAKIAKRDKHRWELDPASAEDYDDR